MKEKGNALQIVQTICLIAILIAMIFAGAFAYKSYKKIQEVAAQINDMEYAASSTIDKLDTTIDNARDTISGAKEAVDTISSTLSTAKDISDTLNTVDNKIQEMNNNPVFRIMNGKTP